jgi:Ca2+-binding EF-hand superfamily protein
MARSNKIAVLTLISISILTSPATANPDHHDGEDQTQKGDTPFVDQSGMQGMSGKGMLGMSGIGEMDGYHMQVVQMMMQMHMSMMGQMHGRASDALAGLFAGGLTNEDIMLRFDANGSGALDLSEFQSWNTHVQRAVLVDRFQAIDSDGADAISMDELAAARNGVSMAAHKAGAMMNSGMTDDEKN